MSNLSTTIEFPRSSPDKLITMAETLLKQHDENAEAVNVESEIIDALRANVALAKQKRADAKAASELSVKLIAEADKILGLAIGQTLDDETTIAGQIVVFRDGAQYKFRKNVDKLKDYGFSVGQKIRKQRAAKPKEEKVKKK